MNILIATVEQRITMHVDGSYTRSFIKSGWPCQWHCIVENGANMTTTHALLTEDEIASKYGQELVDSLTGSTMQISLKNLIDDKRTVN